MAEGNSDNEKSTGPPSPSGTLSPRGSLGSGNIGNNDNTISCAVASGCTSLPSTTGFLAGTVIANESAVATRATASVGIVAMASATATVAPSVVPSSIWTLTSTSASETGAAAAILASGGGGVIGSATLGGSGPSVTKSSGNSSPRSPKHLRKSRVKLSELQLESATREEWAAKWREQDLYVECLEAQAAAQEGELACLRDSEEKYRQQCFEVLHRERILVRRLASKEQQLLGYVTQSTEMRASQTPSASALRSALLDPAVNILVQKLRQELLSTKAKLEDTQNELSAWKFTPDSNTGKRLMAKCRLLYQENEELGRMIASGRIAKLEGELVLQKGFSEEVKKSQSELDEFLQDLDEDVEGMQSTIYFLQQELRKARESVSLLQQENNAFKSMPSHVTSPSAMPPQPPPQPLPPQPPPPPVDNNGLSNGVTPLSHMALVPKVEPTDDDDDICSLGDTNRVDRVNIDRDEDYCVKVGGPRTPLPAVTTATTTTMTTTTTTTTMTATATATTTTATATTTMTSTLLSLNKTQADSPEPDPGRRRLDEPDESSNDSAALIIKVENEELSDREDEDEAASSDSRGPKRSTRTRDRMPIKSESVVDSRSNGDERSSSRSSSRRLLRERTAKRDKSAAGSDDERHLHKKKRRESILSLDYTETDDDALLLTNGESIQSDLEDGP